MPLACPPHDLAVECGRCGPSDGKAFGPAVEVLVSLLTCISFICLLAGNLVSVEICGIESSVCTSEKTKKDRRMKKQREGAQAKNSGDEMTRRGGK